MIAGLQRDRTCCAPSLRREPITKDELWSSSHNYKRLPMNTPVNTLGQEMLHGYVSWMHCFLGQNPPFTGRGLCLLSLANARLICWLPWG